MNRLRSTILPAGSTPCVTARAALIIGLIVSGFTLAPAQTTDSLGRSDPKRAQARAESLLREAERGVDAGGFESARQLRELGAGTSTWEAWAMMGEGR